MQVTAVLLTMFVIRIFLRRCTCCAMQREYARFFLRIVVPEKNLVFHVPCAMLEVTV